jgi:hypothetical protein
MESQTSKAAPTGPTTVRRITGTPDVERLKNKYLIVDISEASSKRNRSAEIDAEFGWRDSADVQLTVIVKHALRPVQARSTPITQRQQ